MNDAQSCCIFSPGADECSWIAASLQDGCRAGSHWVVWLSHCRYSLCAWCMAGIRLAKSFFLFLGIFGVNWVLQRVWANSRRAETQLKPWNCINFYIFCPAVWDTASKTLCSNKQIGIPTKWQPISLWGKLHSGSHHSHMVLDTSSPASSSCLQPSSPQLGRRQSDPPN